MTPDKKKDTENTSPAEEKLNERTHQDLSNPYKSPTQDVKTKTGVGSLDVKNELEARKNEDMEDGPDEDQPAIDHPDDEKREDENITKKNEPQPGEREKDKEKEKK